MYIIFGQRTQQIKFLIINVNYGLNITDYYINLNRVKNLLKIFI